MPLPPARRRSAARAFTLSPAKACATFAFMKNVASRRSARRAGMGVRSCFLARSCGRTRRTPGKGKQAMGVRYALLWGLGLGLAVLGFQCPAASAEVAEYSAGTIKIVAPWTRATPES